MRPYQPLPLAIVLGHFIRGSQNVGMLVFDGDNELKKPMGMLDKISRVHLLAAACCAVLLLTGGLVVIGFVLSEKLYRKDQADIQASPDPVSSSPPPDLLEPLAVPGSTGGRTNSIIQQAMTRCDADAATRSQQPVFSADAGVAGELRERHIAAAAGHATQIIFSDSVTTRAERSRRRLFGTQFAAV